MKIKDAQKHDRLLQAAIHVLATAGLAGFSTTKVAKQAGIPQSNLYIYFKNKQDLLSAVFQFVIHEESVAVTDALDETTAIVDQLVASIHTIYRYALSQPEYVTVVQTLLDDGQMKRSLQLKAGDQANQRVQQLLRDGVDQRVLRPINLNLHRYFLTRPVFNFAAGVQSGVYQNGEQGLATVTTMIMAAVLLPTVYQSWLGGN
ncbi:TetR/AcrR family transcriptional regulator [Levilactobacillus hammesii]|uniref:HTH tetR-type domain-containing protein n=1 Tax=Levilactobacillus hammesii DSM 16381 TaxID=1423753 RepID=A0A0R1V4T5_9LACO|nr:TetR/AcrR family transcriptional regulator [Levilactobacillus hammesii]KRL98312.1 hypothetical protein FD28_GL000111 [Levilactobacillus hammesii DSM 16381]